MVLNGIHKLIDTADSKRDNFPPTLLYNEGWLLRLALAWFARHKVRAHPLAFEKGATWFSEALLPSPFRPRHRGDRHAETRTHADGIIGHFSIGRSTKADARLLPDATQLIVVEAKMFSPLSSGTRNAPHFDQAARNVACVTELLGRANRRPSAMTSLAFFVVVPQSEIRAGAFTQKLDKTSIRAAVQARAELFMPELQVWMDEWFLPTLEAIRIGVLSWESIMDDIAPKDPKAFQSIKSFYERCLDVQRPRQKAFARLTTRQVVRKP
ncbi:MAG: hypothetical protein AB1649_29305 [Chloroflexota bacterium]